MGYFQLIGNGFFSVLTLGDYISSEAWSLPWIATGFAIGMCLDAREGPPLAPRWRTTRHLLSMAVLGVLLYLLFFFTSDGIWMPYFISVACVWPLFASYTFFRYEYIQENPGVGILISAGALFLAASFIAGHDRAHTNLFKNVYRFATVVDGERKELGLLSYLDRGVLGLDNENSRVVFLTWDKVDAVWAENAAKQRPSLVCQWFQVWCKAP